MKRLLFILFILFFCNSSYSMSDEKYKSMVLNGCESSEFCHCIAKRSAQVFKTDRERAEFLLWIKSGINYKYVFTDKVAGYQGLKFIHTMCIKGR